MRFYKKLKPISAISFDLDDTLYSNQPVMQTVYKKMLAFFAEHLPMPAKTISGDYDYQFWFIFRQQAIANDPAVKHDVTELRRASYRLGILSLGFREQAASDLANQALDYFYFERSNFTVPPTTHRFLAELAKKYPLVAITNGNVDVNAIGIAHYFQHIYQAGGSYQQKPEPDMFQLACQQLNIIPQQLLHVGDCGRADVQGALNYGCQAIWFNQYQVGKPIKVLPHAEVNNLKQLKSTLLQDTSG